MTTMGLIDRGVSSARRRWHGYAIALAGVAAVSVAIGIVSTRVAVPNISLLYLPVVLAAAGVYGQGPAILAAVAAALAYDFFFVGLSHDFTLAAPQRDVTGWLTLLLLLVTAMVAGQLAAAVRRRALEATRRSGEIAVLYEVALALGEVDSDRDRALRAVAELLRPALSLAAVEIALDGDDGAPRVVVGVPPPGRGNAAPPGHRLLVPVRAGGRCLGMIELLQAPAAAALDDTHQRLLATLAAHLGATVERARLRRAATEAETLRRADELKSALLAAVSHDLRTPLAAIIAAAGNLQQEDVPWTPAEWRGLAASIEGEARRLNRIVTNLLDLSRIDADALRPQRGWYDLGTLVDEALGRLRSVTAGHHLAIDVPEDLPPLWLDYIQIDQVLANLVENATKYAPAGTTIRVAACAAGGEALVAVADEGPGIPDAALPHLFVPFYRAEPTTRGQHGTGLGLAVARGLVAAHGGRIWAENQQCGGARFVFALPLAGGGVARGGAREGER